MLTIKIVQKNQRQFLQKVWSLWHNLIFVYIDEDFAINWIQPNFLSLLLTGKYRRGVAKRVRLKGIPTTGEYTVIQRLCIAKSRRLHTQNLPWICRIYFEYDHLYVQKLEFCMTFQVYLVRVLQNGRFWDDPTSLTHKRIKRVFQYIWTSHPSP